MKPLDLSSLEKAIGRLGDGIREADAEPANELIRDGVIQRFEYTYELAWKMLKRFLESTSANPAEVDEMSFQTLIRTGSERGLLRGGWDRWIVFRKARGTTSHTYDADKAGEVFRIAPDFLEEARFLLERLRADASS